MIDVAEDTNAPDNAGVFSLRGKNRPITMCNWVNNCAIAGLLACASCSEKVMPPTVVQPAAKLPAPTISPGERPRLIRDARFFVVSDFMAAIENKEIAEGDWACVEGPILQAGERFGADYLAMPDSDGRLAFSCEGGDLGRYQIAP